MIDLSPLIPDEQANDNGIQKGWTAIWELAARYHRYEVEGLEHVTQDPDNRKASLIVGYHGRPLAVDLCILSVRLRRLLGYFPHCFMHRHVRSLPGGEDIIESLGFVTHDDGTIENAVANGEHILVPPGGASEGMRTFRDNYQVRWPSSGYARLAVRHKLDIIPVACAGADDTYLGLLDGEKIVERLGVDPKWSWAPWTGLGPIGLYPFSPPFPAKLYQVIGEPISTQGIDVKDRDAISDLHQLVMDTVQDLLVTAKVKKEMRG